MRILDIHIIGTRQIKDVKYAATIKKCPKKLLTIALLLL